MCEGGVCMRGACVERCICVRDACVNGWRCTCVKIEEQELCICRVHMCEVYVCVHGCDGMMIMIKSSNKFRQLSCLLSHRLFAFKPFGLVSKRDYFALYS